MMENVTSKDGFFENDLEMGATCNNLNLSGGEEIGNNNNNNNINININNDNTNTRMMKQIYSKGCNGGLKVEERVVSSVATCCGDEGEHVRLMVVEERSGDVPVPEMKIVKERPKAMSAKKPPKPPRPPRGLSLDSSDQKLIRELHELAKLKRARVERMKALKKAKEAKVASSKNQLFATFLTVLFCLVVLLQGISSRTSTAASFQGSPISSGVTAHSIISVQQNPILSASYVNGPHSESLRLVEQSTGGDTTEQAS